MGRLTEAIRTFLPLKFREKASSVCNNDDTSVVWSHCTYAKNPEEYRRVNAMKSQQVKKKRCRRRKRRCQVCTALRCIQAREERGCPCVSGRVNAFGTTRVHAWNAMCSHRAQTIRTVE